MTSTHDVIGHHTAQRDISNKMEAAIQSSIKPDTMANSETPNSKKTNINNSEVCKFYLSGRCRFSTECRNIHPACASPPPTPRKNSVEKIQPELNEKKPSMKTAANVINRILWDEKLQLERFTIGYLDRFLGIIEKPFEAFSWEHPAEVDITVLAIPKHRIQYFKYRGIKVWDKNERLDLVFGSTGAQRTIIEAMVEIDEKETVKLEGDVNKMADLIAGSVEIRELVNEDVKPTHFICVKITDPEVVEKCIAVQKELVRHEPCYADYVIPADDFHVTLAIMNLDNAGIIVDTVELLKAVGKELDKLPLITLNVGGLDFFHQSILFAKIRSEDVFLRFVDGLVAKFSEAGVCVIVDRPNFVPHVTLVKTSALLPEEKRCIEPVLVRRVCEDEFGVQSVDNLALFSVEKNKEGLHECLAVTKVVGSG